MSIGNPFLGINPKSRAGQLPEFRYFWKAKFLNGSEAGKYNI